MSELPEGIEPASVPVPRPSASCIVLRPGASGDWEVLLGLRARKSRFMPGHLSFPGGGLDAVDGDAADDAAYARCASRELGEEAGLTVPAGDWAAAGERITPALFPMRFLTRFFVVRLADELAAGEPVPASPENEQLLWATPRAALEQWQSGESRVPPPVLPILRALDSPATRAPEELATRVAETNSVEQRAPRIEFVPDVWMLPVKTATLPPATHTNVWMPGGRKFVVIDPGSAEAEEHVRLLEVIERRRAAGHRPLAVLLTHHHGDHTAGAAALCRALGLPLRASDATLRLLGEVDGVEAAPLADGEEIDLDGMRLRAMLTPGHAEGHMVFELLPTRLLVTGDLVSGLSTILVDPQTGDMDAYLASLARAEALDCRTLLPGHGPPLPARRLPEMIAHRNERERRILEQLDDRERSLAEIARQAYAEIPEMPPLLIERQTLAHLLRLERQGRATRRDAEGGAWRAGKAG